MEGYSAHTNGPGSIDDRRYPQNATFMTHLSPASCQFTLGSAVLRKNTKKTQPVYFGDMPNTGGTLLHKRPLIHAGMLETDRRRQTPDANEDNQTGVCHARHKGQPY